MDRLEILFEKYRNNQCSSEELEELLGYFRSGQNEDRLKALIDESLSQKVAEDNELQTAADEVYARLRTRIQPEEITRTRRFATRWAIAASILIALGTGGYFVIHRSAPPKPTIAQIKPGTFKNDAIPGNKAFLTLANGKQIAVSSLPVGQISTIAGANVQKASNGTVIYQAATTADPQLVYNTFTVPRGGGKHEIKLADGTLAVLDAGSSIRFPMSFTGKDRKVEITGQVYFEVVHNAAQPFYVTAGNQTIQDIGTHFNVNAFDGEVKTTLLEGSVKVNNILLQPGQQAVENANGSLSIVNNVNEQEVIAWKNDLFMFGKNTSLQTVMNQLSRWYDMDIEYQGKVKVYHFGGDMPRYSKLSDVLKILAYSGVQFSVDGKTIIVYQ